MRKKIRRALSLILVLAMVAGTVDYSPYQVYAEGNEEVGDSQENNNETEPTSVEVTGYEKISNTFDITMHLSKGEGVEDLSEEVSGVKVFISDLQTVETSMTISGSTATIEDVPVYIKKGTGNLQDGGTGEYEVDASIYSVTIPTISGQYSLSFSDGSQSSGINLSKDDNDLNWEVSTKNGISVTARQTTSYSYTAKVYGDTVSDSFPIDTKDMKASYSDNGNTATAESSIKSEGNSTFTISYKVPSDVETGSVKVTVPALEGFQLTKGEEEYSPAEVLIDEVNGGTFTYIQQTSIAGTIKWQDSSDSSHRLTETAIRGMLKLYKTGDTLVAADSYTLNLTGTNTDTWGLEMAGLPAYSDKGTLINYYFKLGDEEKISCGNSGHSSDGYYYNRSYNNGSTSPATNMAYSGAALYMSLARDDAQFTVRVNWRDDATGAKSDVSDETKNALIKAAEKYRDEEADKGITLYLWRSTSSDYSKGAAVYDDKGNQYSVSLTKDNYTDKDAYEISQTDFAGSSTKLPCFSENGKLYYYYVTAVDQGSYYKVSYENGKKYAAFTEGTDSENQLADDIYLTRTGTGNIKAQLDWTKAKGESDYIGSKATLALLGKASDSNDWTSIQNADGEDFNLTTTQASSNRYTFDMTFKDVNLFDENGKSLEFTVIESLVADAAGAKTQVTDWSDDEASFTYKDHGYKAQASTVKDSDGNIDYYKVENILSSDMELELISQWSNNIISLDDSVKIQDYRTKLADQLEKGNITYNIQRSVAGETATDYATIQVTGLEGNSISYEVTVDNKTESKTGQLTNTSASSTGMQCWTFSGITVPKYDENGLKYTYSVSSESTSNSDHSWTKSTYPSMGIYYEVSYDDSDYKKTVIKLQHEFEKGDGPTYYMTAQVKWVDSLTDIGSRQVDADVIALYKRGDSYYLLKEYDKDLQLTASNSFKKMVRFKPLSESNLAELTAITGENPSLDNVYYTAVEKTLKYAGAEYQIPYYDEDTRLVNKAFLLSNNGNITSPVLYETANEQNIKIYSYDMTYQDETDSQLFQADSADTGAHYYNKTLQNTIKQMRLDLDVKVNWNDSDDAAGYRKTKLKLTLYRTAGGKTEKAQDKDGKAITKEWTHTDEKNKADGAYTVTFENLEMYNDKGQPYTYSVKQYLLDQDGNETLIDPEATVYNTKSNYVSESSETNGTEVKGASKYSDAMQQVDAENYISKQSIAITNTASNLDYTTQFYIIWHDEAAYKASSRADMAYTLYYQVDGSSDMQLYDQTDYDCVIKTATTGVGGVTNNPYYQKVVYSGLTEYIDGKHVTYYVHEYKNDSAQGYYSYQIDYYDALQSKVVEGPSVSGLTGIVYNHYKFSDDIPSKCTVDTVTDQSSDLTVSDSYVAENQVLVNSLLDTVNISGLKQWVNMDTKGSMPVCTFYLFRSSAYDTSKASSEETVGLSSAPGDGTYLATTKLTDNYSKYKFTENEDGSGKLTDYPKYDSYGAAYTYDTRELITDDKGAVLDFDIMTASNNGNQTVINTFNPDGKNSRSITVNKTWNTEVTDNYPNARFYIYAMEVNYTVEGKYPKAEDIDYSQVLKALNLGSQSLDDYLKSQAAQASNQEISLVDTVMLTYDKDAKGHKSSKTIDDLDIYATDGKPYVYFVVEDTIYSPSFAPSNTGADTESVTVETGYKAADNVVIASNTGLTLEDDSNSSPIVMLTSLLTGDNTIESNTKAQVTFANILKQETFNKITGTIKWQEGQTSIRETARPSVDNKGSCPDITLNLSRFAATQSDLTSGNKIDGSTDSINYTSLAWTDNNDGTWTYEINLDKAYEVYATNGMPYSYRVTESFADGTNTKANYAISGSQYKAADKATDKDGTKTLEIPAITNRLGGNYTVSKSWGDGNDSYGLRPAKVLFMYQYSADGGSTWQPLTYATDVEGKAGQVITGELTKADKWKYSFTTFPYKPNGENAESYRYRAIELGFGYSQVDGTIKWKSVTGIDLSGYQTNGYLEAGAVTDFAMNSASQTSLYDSNQSYGDKTDQYGSLATYGSYKVLYPAGVEGLEFSAKHPSQTTTIVNSLDAAASLTVIKEWLDNDDEGNSRPDSIQLTLQRRTVTGSEDNASFGDWTDVSEIIMTADGAKGNTWTKTFSNLPANDEHENKLQYRVIEKKGTVEGYKMTECQNSSNDDYSSHTCKLTNTLLTEHNLKVSYEGDSDLQKKYSTRPNSTKARLQFRLKGDKNWSNITNDCAIASLLAADINYNDLQLTDASKDSYTIVASQLPACMKIGQEIKDIEYRIIETQAIYPAATLAASYDNETASTKDSSPLALSQVDASATSGAGTDRVVAGYTYDYNDQDNALSTQTDTASTTYLVKKLLTVNISGLKVWKDASNKYNTRPSLPENGVQTDTSQVQLGLYMGDSDTAEKTTIYWTLNDNDSDSWKYKIGGAFPKYMVGSSSLQTYSIKYTAMPAAYRTSYDNNGQSALLALNLGAGDVSYPVTDITSVVLGYDLEDKDQNQDKGNDSDTGSGNFDKTTESDEKPESQSDSKTEDKTRNNSSSNNTESSASGPTSAASQSTPANTPETVAEPEATEKAAAEEVQEVKTDDNGGLFVWMLALLLGAALIAAGILAVRKKDR